MQTWATWWHYLAETYAPTSGGAFELIHPAFLVLTVVVSAFVLSSARKRGLAWYAVAAWTAGVLLFPQITVPMYWAWLLWLRRAVQPVAGRYVVPFVYLLVTLGGLGVWLYREYHTVEAYLARAQQYRVLAWHEQAARELNGALARENNPHIHNLLGRELGALKRWDDALREFQTAAAGGEPDLLLPFRMGEALHQLNRRAEARIEYRRFQLASCQSSDEFTEPCAIAWQRLAKEELP